MFLSRFLIAALASPAFGNVFLAAQSQGSAHTLDSKVVMQVLNDELEHVSSARSQMYEEELRPMFASMPKNEHGNLAPATVRYVLHRYFVHKHGWYVKGLDPAGSSWNDTSPLEITKEQAPAFIQAVFERRVHGEGLNLQALAVFAATMSDLIHHEALSDIGYIFEAEGLTHQKNINADQLDDVLEIFLATYLHGEHDIDFNYSRTLEKVRSDHFAWDSYTLWMQDLRLTVDTWKAGNPFSSGYTFEDAVMIAQEFVHRFGTFQNMDCRVMQGKLVDLEDEGTGRVPLTRFYSGRFEADWTFIESAEYLRDLGALDETNPRRPAVIISNYLQSKGNCVDPSDFYSVCCKDECESLMSHIEYEIGSPSGTPARLSEIVSNLESDTVAAPRNLSASLLGKLHDIAEHHGGHVPLHGRLFLQWMHHAYPHECQFPHLPGTVVHSTPEAWAEATGAETFEVSTAEVRKYRSMSVVSEEITPSSLPWTHAEELVAEHHHGDTKSSRFSSMAVMLALGIVVSLGTSYMRLPQAPAHKSKQDKYLV